MDEVEAARECLYGHTFVATDGKRYVGLLAAPVEARIASAIRAGRQAGLREAAAKFERVPGHDWIAREILALIDAGSPPPLRNASREEAAGWPSLKQIMDAGSQKPPTKD